MPCRGLRFVLSVVFYVVNENPQNRIRLKSCKKQKKTPETIGFQVLFGAAGRIRTADLILTNYKKAVVACRWLLCLIACIPLFSTVA